MNKFKDFNYPKILLQEIKSFPLVHDLDFTKLSGDEWFQHHVKMALRYTIPHKCGCGTRTRTSNQKKILKMSDYKKVKTILLKDVPELFMWLMMSIEWRDLVPRHLVFPEKFRIHVEKYIDADTIWGATFRTIDFDEMYALAGSRNDYPTVTRIKW